MDKKTPGQVAYEGFYSLSTGWPCEGSVLWEQCAAAVIAHVREQIEAEARKATREQCAKLCRELGKNKTSGAYRQCAVAIENLKD